MKLITQIFRDTAVVILTVFSASILYYYLIVRYYYYQLSILEKLKLGKTKGDWKIYAPEKESKAQKEIVKIHSKCKSFESTTGEARLLYNDKFLENASKTEFNQIIVFDKKSYIT